MNNSGLELQVSANAGQIFTINLFDARTPNLGIDDIKVDPWEEAQKAIEKIDAAIQKASSARGRFGAYQNALEHIKNNVSNYKINLTAAESQLRRDLDMAKEMTRLANKQVVLQASQARLAKANQIPQSILQFLK